MVSNFLIGYGAVAFMFMGLFVYEAIQDHRNLFLRNRNKVTASYLLWPLVRAIFSALFWPLFFAVFFIAKGIHNSIVKGVGNVTSNKVEKPK